MVHSYITELIGACNNLSHERKQSLHRFADTCALLLEAIKSEDAGHMRDIATRLSPGYVLTTHLNGNGNGNGNSNVHHISGMHPALDDEPAPILELYEEDFEGPTERLHSASPDAEYFIIITTPDGQAVKFWIPKDKKRFLIGRGTDISIND